MVLENTYLPNTAIVVIDTRKYDKETLSKNVSTYRQEYSNKFKTDKSVILSLAAEYALNQAMSEFMSKFTSSNEKKLTFPLEIKHDTDGKAIYDTKTLSEFSILGIKPPFFSLSHSGDFAVAAVSEFPVGIDIQKLEFCENGNLEDLSSKTIKYDNLAKRFFSPDEVAHLSKFSDDLNRTERFFILWTMKEAFLKASGTAGKLAMSEFTIDFSCRDDKTATCLYNGRNYISQILNPPESNYRMAVLWEET